MQGYSTERIADMKSIHPYKGLKYATRKGQLASSVDADKMATKNTFL